MKNHSKESNGKIKNDNFPILKDYSDDYKLIVDSEKKEKIHNFQNGTGFNNKNFVQYSIYDDSLICVSKANI